MSLPFGYVISVQITLLQTYFEKFTHFHFELFFPVVNGLVKIRFFSLRIVKTGFGYSLVTFSNADDAAVAVIKLSGNKRILVGLFEPREVREAHKNERSESLLQDGFMTRHGERLPSLFDTLYPPAYIQVMGHLNCDFLLYRVFWLPKIIKVKLLSSLRLPQLEH